MYKQEPTDLGVLGRHLLDRKEREEAIGEEAGEDEELERAALEFVLLFLE